MYRMLLGHSTPGMTAHLRHLFQTIPWMIFFLDNLEKHYFMFCEATAADARGSPQSKTVKGLKFSVSI